MRFLIFSYSPVIQYFNCMHAYTHSLLANALAFASRIFDIFIHLYYLKMFINFNHGSQCRGIAFNLWASGSRFDGRILQGLLYFFDSTTLIHVVAFLVAFEFLIFFVRRNFRRGIFTLKSIFFNRNFKKRLFTSYI